MVRLGVEPVGEGRTEHLVEVEHDDEWHREALRDLAQHDDCARVVFVAVEELAVGDPLLR